MEEEYYPSTITIDNETFSYVGIRVKGNNSKTQVNKYDLYRYSLKVEFDHYDESINYHGLDKFSLDSSFQDNTYMKTYIAYELFEKLGVRTPYTSYTWVTIKNKPWGLFLAIEEPEESYLRRNYDVGYGQLYKPDYKKLDGDNRDVYLQYKGDDITLYNQIFDKAKTEPSKRDKHNLVNIIKQLHTKENLRQIVNIPETLGYFIGNSYMMNLDSYLGQTGHNYFLYQEANQIKMLPWDFNLVFGTYQLGKTNPITDPKTIINYPITTPEIPEILHNRHLYHHLMKDKSIYQEYKNRYNDFINNLDDLEVVIEKQINSLNPT